MRISEKIIILDCYPDQAQYIYGRDITIVTEIKGWRDGTKIEISLTWLSQTLVKKFVEEAEPLSDDTWRVTVTFQGLPCGGYGVDACVSGCTDVISTAFDVAENHSDDIRYGFLSDFAPEEGKDSSDVLFANKLHLNALQFYDWMWKHEKLVSNTVEYQDPMGRSMSLDTVMKKITDCKEWGIRPFAYGAVYAADRAFYEKHSDWALYKLNGKPIDFADEWLIYMNTSIGSPWTDHIVGEYADAVKTLGFQGIHMDTYGFPKNAWDYKKHKVALAKTFPDLINRSREAVTSIDPAGGVIFNAVNNWPVESIASSNQDAIYIEVWPPHDTYHDLYALIREAKYMAAKPVILAAYMKPFQSAQTPDEIEAAETSLLLANAVISASGGHQLVFGENSGILCDSYYVKYAKMRGSFIPSVRAYCDFVVRYKKLLYSYSAMDVSMTAANGINEDVFSVQDPQIRFSSCGDADTVWTIVRESEKYLVLQFINLVGVDSKWNMQKPVRPIRQTNIKVEILMDRSIGGVYLATPDFLDCRPSALVYNVEQRKDGQYVIFEIPELDIWDLIWIEIM